MRLGWNAKADAASTLVLWLGVLMAALICVAWLAQNLYPEHLILQQVDNELNQLQKDIGTACRMSRYWKNYYPQLQTGNLIINDMEICIDSSECKSLYYLPGSGTPRTEKGDIIIEGDPCPSIDTCSVYYYMGSAPPVYAPGIITIPNSTACADKHQPIKRCRILICQTGINETFNLKEINYINITKEENGAFSFQKQ